MIRVLHIGLSDSFGGIESFLLNLHKAIDCKMFHFDYVAYGPDTPREDEFRILGAKVYHLTNRKNPIIYARELHAIISNGYDVVHVHKNSCIDTIPIICAKKSGIKALVAHAHNASHDMGAVAQIMHAVGAMLYKDDAIVKLACSREAARWLFPKSDYNSVEIIYNGVDATKCAFDLAARARGRERWGLGDSLVIGEVGRLAPQKNQSFLLKVLKCLLESGIDAKLLLVGDGPDYWKLKESSNLLGVASHVVFAGSMRDVQEALCAMDVFAMPSIYEGLPIAAIEAQASGLPLVVSNTISLEARLTERYIELGIDMADICDWAAAIALFKQGKQRQELPALPSAYGWKNIGEKMMEFYQCRTS